MQSYGGVVRQLHTLFRVGTHAGLTDGQLLERFANREGEAAEAAFEALVERHGPTVLRLPGGPARPERRRGCLSGDLPGVAEKRPFGAEPGVGRPLAARRGAAGRPVCQDVRVRRCFHEKRAAELDADRRDDSEAPADPDRKSLLYEEIGRLPGRFRAVILACDLDGQSHERAAQTLGWPVGTVKSRLSRGRDLLRARLLRRGLAPAAGLVAAGVADVQATAMTVLVPPALVHRTAQAAASLAAGGAGALSQVVTSSVLTITGGVMRGMILAKLKVSVAVLLAGGLLGLSGLIAGGALQADGGPSGDRASPPGVLLVKSARPASPTTSRWEATPWYPFTGGEKSRCSKPGAEELRMPEGGEITYSLPPGTVLPLDQPPTRPPRNRRWTLVAYQGSMRMRAGCRCRRP